MVTLPRGNGAFAQAGLRRWLLVLDTTHREATQRDREEQSDPETEKSSLKMRDASEGTSTNARWHCAVCGDACCRCPPVSFPSAESPTHETTGDRTFLVYAQRSPVDDDRQGWDTGGGADPPVRSTPCNGSGLHGRGAENHIGYR